MEYKFKQAETADMCQRIISAIAGKYIDQILENNGRLDISIIQTHADNSGKKIVIEVSKDVDATIKAMPLPAKHTGRGNNLWDFISNYLPDYYHRDDILHFDIYSRFVDNEDVCESDLEWIYSDFGSDKNKVQEVIDQMEMEFAFEALNNWLEGHGPEDW